MRRTALVVALCCNAAHAFVFSSAPAALPKGLATRSLPRETGRPPWGYYVADVAAAGDSVVAATAAATAAVTKAAAKLPNAPTLAIIRVGASADSANALANSVAAAVMAAVPSITMVLGFSAENFDSPRPAVAATVADVSSLGIKAFHFDAIEMPAPEDERAWVRALGARNPVSSALPPTFLLFPSEEFMFRSLVDSAAALDRAYPDNKKLGEVVGATGGSGTPAAFVALAGGAGLPQIKVLRDGVVGLMLDTDCSSELEAVWGWESRLLALTKWATTMGH